MHSASSAASQGGIRATLVAPLASSSSHTVLQGRQHSALLTPIGRCHGALYSPWPLLCPSVAPCGPRCGPRWIAGRQPHRPAAADVPWRRPLAGGTSSPPLRTPAHDASKSCPPADHPQTLNAAPTSRSALCSALFPSTANRYQQAIYWLAGWQCSASYSAVQRSSNSSRHPEKRPGAPSSWPAANRFLLQPRTLPFSSSLFQLVLPAVIPIIPQTLQVLLASDEHHERAVSSAQLHSYNTPFARIQAYRLIVPLLSPPE